MSLKDTLLEYAIDLKDLAEQDRSLEALRAAVLKVSYELKGLARGITDEHMPQRWVNPVAQFGTSKEISHQALYQQALTEAREAKAKAGIETFEPRITPCVDGPEGGTYVPINPDMPEGAMTRVGSSTYELKGGKLYWKQAPPELGK